MGGGQRRETSITILWWWTEVGWMVNFFRGCVTLCVCVCEREGYRGSFVPAPLAERVRLG